MPRADLLTKQDLREVTQAQDPGTGETLPWIHAEGCRRVGGSGFWEVELHYLRDKQ